MVAFVGRNHLWVATFHHKLGKSLQDSLSRRTIFDFGVGHSDTQTGKQTAIAFFFRSFVPNVQGSKGVCSNEGTLVSSKLDTPNVELTFAVSMDVHILEQQI